MSLLESGHGFGSPVEKRIRGMQTARSFVGMDVLKETISISVAEDGRNGPVRFLGMIPNAADHVAKMAKRLSKHGELDFCYEASGWGCGIRSPLTAHRAVCQRIL
jgi:transposase